MFGPKQGERGRTGIYIKREKWTEQENQKDEEGNVLMYWEALTGEERGEESADLIRQSER